MVAFIATLLAILFYHLAPLKVVELKAPGDLDPYLFSDSESGGKSEARWLDYQNVQWECIKRKGDTVYPVCGGTLNIKRHNKKTFNFSAYDYMYLHFLSGENVEKIRMYIRNYNPIYSDLSDFVSHKPNSIALDKKEFKNNRVKIKFNEFNVGDWWLDKYNVPRDLLAPEFDRVTGISFEVAGAVQYGQPYIMGFEKLVLVGRWVSAGTLYICIASIWLLILGVESGKQAYHFYQRSVTDSRKVEYLTDYASELKRESEKYKELSAVDPLTGIFNRAGFSNRVKGVLSGCRDNTSIGLIVFDIDHFKNINDSFGHDVGDEILKDLADAISFSLRDSDTFARWGGEEFVVLSVVSREKSIPHIGEKIRRIVESQKFGADGRHSITISLGLTVFHAGESFEAAFKRADTALYQAKSNGRNRLELIWS